MIAFLGGTFDPIHLGHLHIANSILQKLPLKEIQFVPCGKPPHRNVVASAKERLDMLRLAIKKHPQLTINEIEIFKTTPCFTVETLQTLQKFFPENTMCWIIGSDIFPNLNTWHRWTEILTFGHLLIVARPGYEYTSIQEAATKLGIAKHLCENFSDLQKQKNGYIYFLDIPLADISATHIRRLFKTDAEKARKFLTPEVFEYIRRNKIY